MIDKTYSPATVSPTDASRTSDHVQVWCLRHAESENVTTGIAGAVPTVYRSKSRSAWSGRQYAAEIMVQ